MLDLNQLKKLNSNKKYIILRIKLDNFDLEEDIITLNFQDDKE